MATMAEAMAKTYKPGDSVEWSGVYLVTHDTTHTQPHEVTVVAGKPFPPCRGCKHPRFKAARLAWHIGFTTTLSNGGLRKADAARVCSNARRVEIECRVLVVVAIRRSAKARWPLAQRLMARSF
jgi:hypothetical protein